MRLVYAHLALFAALERPLPAPADSRGLVVSLHVAGTAESAAIKLAEEVGVGVACVQARAAYSRSGDGACAEPWTSWTPGLMPVWRNAQAQPIALQCGGWSKDVRSMRIARRRQVRSEAAAVRVHLVFESISPLEVRVRALLSLLMWVLKDHYCSRRAPGAVTQMVAL